MSWRSKRAEVVPEEAPAPTDDHAALVEKLAELTHREVALRRITDVVEKQRTSLEEREWALESSASAAAAAGEERLAEAIQRAEQSEQRVRELEQHVSELEARPAPQAEPAAPVEAIEEPLAPAPRPRVLDLDGEPTYTLQRLERLVHEAELRGDPQAEEWAYYLPLLREQAEPDGRLPAQFASLVDSSFAA
jgi:hypothetical protein